MESKRIEVDSPMMFILHVLLWYIFQTFGVSLRLLFVPLPASPAAQAAAIEGKKTSSAAAIAAVRAAGVDGVGKEFDGIQK